MITASGSTAIQLQTRDKRMPYKSDKQRKYFNANRDKIGGKVVDEFNDASKGMKLPMRAGKKIMKTKVK